MWRRKITPSTFLELIPGSHQIGGSQKVRQLNVPVLVSRIDLMTCPYLGLLFNVPRHLLPHRSLTLFAALDAFNGLPDLHPDLKLRIVLRLSEGR